MKWFNCISKYDWHEKTDKWFDLLTIYVYQIVELKL